MAFSGPVSSTFWKDEVWLQGHRARLGVQRGGLDEPSLLGNGEEG